MSKQEEINQITGGAVQNILVYGYRHNLTPNQAEAAYRAMEALVKLASILEEDYNDV